MSVRPFTISLAILFFTDLVAGKASFADSADIVDANIQTEQDGRYSFNVTVRHNDTGWDHFVDRWEILTPDGEIIAVRALRHPHVGEQSFTRPLRYIIIPEEVKQVEIRAHCSRDGYGGVMLIKELP